MAPVRRLVLDVLKPHDPDVREFTQRVTGTDTVEAVSTSLIELDQEVQNVEITIEGEALKYGAIETTIETLGGSIHSVDNVACGTHVPSEEPRQRRR